MNCRNMDLNQKVFGDITAKEIIGATPTKFEIEEKLAREFEILLQELNKKDESELKNILNSQKEIERQVDSRPGAKALAQDKISLFVDYSNRYLEVIQNKLNDY